MKVDFVVHVRPFDLSHSIAALSYDAGDVSVMIGKGLALLARGLISCESLAIRRRFSCGLSII